MNHSELAIAILRKTNDGDDLTPDDLRLVELAVNGKLNQRGEAAFEELHRQAVAGEYPGWRATFLAPHITKEPSGTVRWRGKTAVEHYSFSVDRQAAMLEAAAQLSERCLKLEALGIPVNGRTANSVDCYTAPADSPWLAVLPRYYSFAQRDGVTVGIFFVSGPNQADVKALAIFLEDGQVKVENHPDGYTAFHAYQNRGFTACDAGRSYEQTAALLDAMGIPPTELASLLKS